VRRVCGSGYQPFLLFLFKPRLALRSVMDTRRVDLSTTRPATGSDLRWGM
jgi:hypothetical protein